MQNRFWVYLKTVSASHRQPGSACIRHIFHAQAEGAFLMAWFVAADVKATNHENCTPWSLVKNDPTAGGS